jgi:bifunctional non-homologous end joining protein LigD
VHLFDVLAVGDVDVRPVPLVRRKELVERIVARAKGALRAVPYVVGDGRELTRFVLEHDLEGLVAKRADYVAGPSSSWVKVKRGEEDDFLVMRCRRDREGQIDALAIATLDGRGVRGIVELGTWRVREALPGWRRRAADATRRGAWASPSPSRGGRARGACARRT